MTSSTQQREARGKVTREDELDEIATRRYSVPRIQKQLEEGNQLLEGKRALNGESALRT